MGIRKFLWSSSPPAGMNDPTGIINGGDGGDDDCGDFYAGDHAGDDHDGDQHGDGGSEIGGGRGRSIHDQAPLKLQTFFPFTNLSRRQDLTYSSTLI